MTYKLTNKDFEYFKNKCGYWQNKLSLNTWEIDYYFTSEEGNMAECSTNYEGRKASIGLAKKWQTSISKKELDRTALHEILELLLAPLMSLAQARVWSQDDYIKENHMVIRILEKML